MNFKRLPTYFPVILFIVFALFSCELERDTIDKESYQKKISLRNSNLDMLLQEEPFIAALSKLNKGKRKKGSTAKTVMEDTYKFSIMPDIAKVIQDGSSTTYTFQIKREINNPDFFENLVIRMDSLNQVDAYLVKYTPTAPLTPSEEHASFHFKGMVNITQIEYNIAPSAKELNCVVANVLMCNQAWTEGGPVEPHVATSKCQSAEHLYTVPSIDCSMTGYGGAGAGSGYGGSNGGTIGTEPGVGHSGGGSSNSGGTGNNGNTNPPVTTAPVYVTHADCITISDQFTKFSNLKQQLTTLAGTTSQNHENGIFIDKSATAQTADPFQTIPQGTGGMIKINTNPSQPYVMLAHTHDAYGSDGTGTYSIFSSGDMAVISNLIQKNKIDLDNFVFYVITADGTRYAMTINCAACLEPFCYPCESSGTGTPVDMTRLLKTGTLIDNTYNSDDGIHSQSNPIDDIKKFLEFIKAGNLGINLFEVNETFTSFEKLELDSKTNSIIRKPCPN